MGIKRRVLGGALAGAGESLSQFGQFQIRKRQLDDQRDFELQKLRLGELGKLQDTLAQHPDQVPFTLDSAAANPLLAGMDLSPYRSAAKSQGIRALTSSVNSAKSADDLPTDLGAALSARTGAAYPSVTPSNAADFGAQATQQDVPPELNTILNLASARRGQLTDQKETALGDLGRKKYAESYNTATGANQAANENFPTTMQQQLRQAQQNNMLTLDLERAKNPILTSRAGGEAAARVGAEQSPSAIAGAAAKAGAIAGAQAEHRPVDADSRKAVNFYTRAVSAANNALELEQKGVSPARNAYLPNAVKGDYARRYDAAQREFALTQLRRETGAAISAKELDDYAHSYFAQPGDDPQTIAAKQAARARAVAGLKYEATPALKEFQSLGNQVPIIVQPGTALNKLRGGP